MFPELNTKRFMISWLLAAFLMMGLSLFWHGVILNDIKNIPYDHRVFLALSLIAYLGIAAMLNFLASHFRHEDAGLFRFISIGAVLGFLMFLIVFILGFSYHAKGLHHAVIDLIWQMLEQGAGGFLVGISYRVYSRIDAIHEVE